MGIQKVSTDKNNRLAEDNRETEGVGISKLISSTASLSRIIRFIFSSFLGSHILAALLAAPPVLLLLVWEQPHPSERRSFVLVRFTFFPLSLIPC